MNGYPIVTPPDKVLSLVEVFERNADEYLSAHFNEAMLRQQFVNPLFKCLGWDMDNEQGYAEAYKDVIHEAVIKIGGATKAPDYSFRIGGTPKFYLEAKKPSVNLKDDPAPAFQLRPDWYDGLCNSPVRLGPALASPLRWGYRKASAVPGDTPCVAACS
jgi:hypothetical protein